MTDLAELLAMTGCRDAADLQDMANVGRSLMDAIDINVRPGCRYAGWTPADDPAEIVTDLLNDLTDTEAALAYAKETFRLLLADERARRGMGALYSRCVEAMHQIAALRGQTAVGNSQLTRDA